MTMSGDFLEFVQAYRTQDSVMIESGYSWFAPRWKLLGQSKYLEAYLKQLDCLFKMNNYSRLEKARLVADLLVFIRMLIFLTADFGCVTKKLCAPKIEQESMSFCW